MTNINSSYLFSRILMLFICTVIGLTLVRCDKWIKPENKTQISTHGDDESIDDDHMFNGENCMNCHYSEGRGEGWFSAAGTVIGNNNNMGTINLYQNFGQAPVASIEVDAVGNFYTTETVDFTNGLNVSIVDDQGIELQMSGKIYSGQCNLCHGIITNPLSY
ncbi:MAG: hypothetical protein HRT57_08770 [Crocinitomicaceae bacterium]|nr:hypothetical protein [Crocinitomicaceae bacterium]